MVENADDRQRQLERIADQVRACAQCRLQQSATHGVPGEGSSDAQVMFVGEAPGYHEDKQARPFVGAAGKLLDEMLSGIGLARADVFVTNVVKHRPPGNRDPLPDEMSVCRPFLERQMAIIDPKIVALLGRFAMEQFLPGERISKAHGQPRRLDGRIFLPLIHPAAALHRGDWRAPLEADFQVLKDLLADGLGVTEVRPPADSAAEQLSLF